jgi:hypothetical protein
VLRHAFLAAHALPSTPYYYYSALLSFTQLHSALLTHRSAYVKANGKEPDFTNYAQVN